MGEGSRDRTPGAAFRHKGGNMDVILYWIGILTGEDGQG